MQDRVKSLFTYYEFSMIGDFNFYFRLSGIFHIVFFALFTSSGGEQAHK